MLFYWVKDNLVALAPLFNSVIAVAAIGIAVWQSMVWRREQSGKTDRHVSMEVLEAVFRLRERIRSIRVPFVLGAEMEKAKRELVAQGMEQGAVQRAAHAGALLARLKEATNDVQQLEQAKIKAEALFGLEGTKEIRKFLGQWNKLHRSISYFFRTQADGIPPGNEEKLRAVFEGTFDNADRFHEALEEIVHNIEDGYRPHLK